MRTVLKILVLACAFSACSSDPNHCAVSRDCVGGQVCVASACARPDAGPGPLGASCWSEADCQVGTTCVGESYGLVDGLCTQECENVSCPKGSGCADLRGTSANARLCAQTCSADSDCRNGYGCCASFGNVCLPAGLCPLRGLPASADLGAACSTTSCAAGETCRQDDEFPDGDCTRSCVPGDEASCPAGSRCATTGSGPVCARSCAASADCRAGYFCSTLALDGGVAEGVCEPAGPAPRTCSAQSAPLLISGGLAGPAIAPPGCIEPLGRSALSGSRVQRLGRHPTGDSLQFQLPAGGASFSIVSQRLAGPQSLQFKGQTIGNTVVPTLLVAPDGRLFYDDTAAPPVGGSPRALGFFGADSPALSLFTLPDTSAGLAAADGGLPAGSWTFAVNDYAAECGSTPGCSGADGGGVYDLSVLVAPGPAQDSGTIDVAFYLVGAGSLTSASAPGSTHVRRMVQTLAGVYAQAGLCLGNVTFYDVPAWARAAYATGIDADHTGPCDPLDQMFTLARAGPTLNFFLVEQLISTSEGAGSVVVGIDGTIPGPSTIGGTVHSGAAVSAADLPFGLCGGPVDVALCGADRVAYIVAHEGGHWLGLYHTSEADQAGGANASFDPLDDTPICDCSVCASTQARKDACRATTNATLIQSSECSQSGSPCGGGDNLMFWLLDPAHSRGRVTAQQGQVMRSNPLVQ